jgi:precorrin-3B synthase
MATTGQTTADAGLAMPRLGPGLQDLPLSRLARGACPSLTAPMQTGDGLLVRLRPSTPGLTICQFRQLATAAALRGNGLIEITARGNLQLRGLSLETMSGLEADIGRAGIVPQIGLTIETPPLSGKDFGEIADARAMAARLRDALAGLPAPLTLAPKLTIIVDGGGRLNLDAVAADIRLMAIATTDAKPRWQVAVGGSRASAASVFAGSEEDAPAKVLDLLKTLAALGVVARGRDLLPAGTAPWTESAVPQTSLQPQQSYLGIHSLGAKTGVLGLRPAFGQIHADALIAFLDVAEAGRVDEIRTAPDHALLLLGASAEAMTKLQAAAGTFGFWTDADEPASHIATCSGSGACASATYRTRDIATKAVDWTAGLLDGSMTLHLSGCPKGCAHPGTSALTIVGLPTGYGIIVQGKASSRPDLVVDEDGLKLALRRVALMVRQAKGAGESAGDCLKRLGSEAIIAALGQE